MVVDVFMREYIASVVYTIIESPKIEAKVEGMTRDVRRVAEVQ